ncbi:MAG TPA: type I phosphomannose isomerase catalytic subunit [Terracidiphilus sp.]|nr:type I phosphomannose isomerase catalytic subunit [Terracidiphilus sp.]
MSSASRPVIVEMIPFRIEPQFVSRVWGWNDLRPWYERGPEREPIGEVWLTGDDCQVATGTHAGKTLASLFEEFPQAILGPAAQSAGSPLLVKVIFAREKLSVQVHPDDRLAQKYGQPRGKTECWYALTAEPEAKVAVGLLPGVTMDKVKQGIDHGTLEESLNIISVDPGDLIFVDAGTVHAIWPGSVLLETQQNCDLTYRMYDYGRGRELHIDKSIEATRLQTRAGKIPPQALSDRTVLVESNYFVVEKIPVEVSRSSASLRRAIESTPTLFYLFAVSGSGRISSPSFAPIDLPARGIIAVPSSSPVFAIQDMGGLELIRIAPRNPEMTA